MRKSMVWYLSKTHSPPVIWRWHHRRWTDDSEGFQINWWPKISSLCYTQMTRLGSELKKRERRIPFDSVDQKTTHRLNTSESANNTEYEQQTGINWLQRYLLLKEKHIWVVFLLICIFPSFEGNCLQCRMKWISLSPSLFCCIYTEQMNSVRVDIMK